MVFRFNIWFDGTEDRQERFVVATSESEAEQVLEEYRRKLIRRGFADFTYAGPWVELDNVIVPL